MPPLNIDLIEGRSLSAVQELLDAAHDAVVGAFEVPPENGDEDWSFGHGRAQLLTGELK